MHFLVWIGGVFVIAGSYCGSFTSWIHTRFVRWVSSTLPIISAWSPYSFPVAGSQLHAKVRLSTLLARLDASFLRVL
jgi:hypothetical protein